MSDASYSNNLREGHQGFTRLPKNWQEITTMLLLLLAFAHRGAGTGAPEDGLDVKVARGLGAHGYDAVRITVIGGVNGTVDPTAFSYNAPFKYRWTDRLLHTTLINATPGQMNSYTIGKASLVGPPTKVAFHLPSEGAAVRGVFFGDPCTEPGFVGCIHFNATTPGATNMYVAVASIHL
jgi:hypothetical protein